MDILRGVSALAIAVGHILYVPTNATLMSEYGFRQFQYDPISNPIYLKVLNLLAPSGTWVMIFFLISGYAVEGQLQKLTAKKFLIKRIIRIYPPMVFTYCLWILLEKQLGHFSQTTALDYLGDLLLLTGGLPIIGGPWLYGLLWTLWYEVKYYFLSVSFRGRSSHLIVRLGIFLSTAILFMLLHLKNSDQAYLVISTFCYGLAFITVGAVFRKFDSGEKVVVEVSIFTLGSITLASMGSIPFFYQEGSKSIWMAFAIFAIFSRLHFGSDGIIATLFDHLGRVSYSLYLSHFVFGVGAYVVLAYYLNAEISLLLCFVSTSIGTALTYLLIERPTRALSSRI